MIDEIRHILLMTTIVLCSIQVCSQRNDSIFYSFTHTNTTYTFHGRFRVDAEKNCLLEICFDYEHIKALALDASKVELIEQSKNWNKIKYTYQQYPFYKNESLWYRTIDHKNSIINFKLVSSKNNHSIMPRMISSSGYYKVSQIREATWVEYFQQCCFTRSNLSSLFQHYMKKKAVEFIYLFQEYSQKHCNHKN